jgi:hypothetical protein
MPNRDFKECVASFNAHGVEYLVAESTRPKVGDALKIWLVSALAAATSALFLFGAAKAISIGHVRGRRYLTGLHTQADSPIVFYAVVVASCILGVLMFAASVVLATAKGQRRDRMMSYLDKNAFSVRPSVRWLLVAFLLLLCALAALIVFRALRG